MVPPRLPTETDREIAWNYLHDNRNNRGINIYSEQPYAAYIEDHRVHDNVIVNQRGVGILMGQYVTGENWVFNNLVDQAGRGPDWDNTGEGPSGHTCLQVDVGTPDTPAAATALWVYHNSFARCGYGPTETPDPNYLGAAGALTFGEVFSRAAVEIRNNLIFSEGNDYVAEWTSGTPPAAAYTNLWFGLPAAPAWDTAAVTGDPRFSDLAAHDLHLLPGSAAIDAGTDLGAAVVIDLDGVTRPQGPGFDLGAYESVIACGSAADCANPPSCRTAAGAACDAGVCVYPADPGAACNDGDPCTGPDTCDAAAACVPGPNTCPTCTDGDGDGYGDPASPACSYPERDCDDADAAVSPGASEDCNRIDDDCDGSTDEGCVCNAGESRDCYGGPEGTRDVGACHGGTQACVGGGWVDCQGQIMPTAEVCHDSLDNDCDGLTDPDCPPEEPDGGCGCGGGGAPGMLPSLAFLSLIARARRRAG
jgi:hypothetical protein